MEGKPLLGARIWLSGSAPQVGSESVVSFVREFSRMVFHLGGHIVHGSHPSFVPVLLEEAARFQADGGRKDCLALVVSRFWSKANNQPSVERWDKNCVVYETPEVTGDSARERSLDLLRTWIAARSDAVVAVGGRQDPTSGVPREIELAHQGGLPCFVIGGLGGAAAQYAQFHRDVVGLLKNGFDDESNVRLATTSDLSGLVTMVVNQLTRLPLVRGHVLGGPSFRILALDGGGIKGTFTAAALSAWEKQTGLRIVDHFDLVAGTSTGGILAIGLAMGLTATEMLNFYRTRGPVIFPITTLPRSLKYAALRVFRPKYSQEVLLRELSSALYQSGVTKRLRDALCRLVIPTYHAVGGSIHQFRTPHHSALTGDADTPAAYAALATAAAPTYFAAAKVANMDVESAYFDGGVWANCPAMAAIVEAVCFLSVPPERIDVLSVGTTDEPFTVRQQVRAGILRWTPKMLRLLMSAQEESALRHAKLLVGEPRFFRVNTVTAPGTYKLDGVKEITELAGLGVRAAMAPEVLVQVRSRFINGVRVVPWENYASQPVR